MVLHAVEVMKDRPLVDLLVLVVGLKFHERPVGGVLAAIAAVFAVDLEWETLVTDKGGTDMKIDGHTRCQLSVCT